MENSQELFEWREKLITQKKSVLLATIRLSPSFWASLCKYEVLRNDQIQDIQRNGTASPTTQIDELLNHVIQIPDTRYTGLLRALVDTGQGYVITEVLKDKLPEPVTTQTSSPQLQTSLGDLSAEKCQNLRAKLPGLIEETLITDKFWSVLMRNHVLSQFEVEEFKGESKATNAQQVQSLIEYLVEGTNKMYRGFLYALSETGQRHVVTELLKDNVPDLSPSANKEQDPESSVLITAGKKKVLREKAPELIHKIQPSSLLWTQMVKHGAIPESDINDIKTENGSDATKVTNVLEILQKSTMRHYYGFVRSLVESNQIGVVTDILMEDITNYKLNTAGPVIVNPKLNEAVVHLKREYCNKMASSNLYEGSDFEDVYTPLDLAEIVNGETRRITENEILQKTDDGPVSTLFLGEAGTGKSTQAHRVAQQWAKGQQDSFFWSKIKAVLLIQPTDEEDTLKQTLRNSIPGKKVHKDLIWDLYLNEPEAVLLIVEAFDQFQEEGVLRDIKQVVKDRATNILLTTRKNHPCLTKTFRSLFTQHVEVNGFTLDDSVQYVKKFFKQTECNDIHDAFLSSLKGKPVFQFNPLNLMLSCQLFSSGEIDHTQLETLTEVELYSMREHRIIERELEFKRQCDTKDIPERKTVELDKIHSLAVYMILTNKTKCKRADLNYLKIDINSPMMVLLQEYQSSSTKYGKDYYWVWHHSRLQEFDAAMALVSIEAFSDSLWPLWVASRPDLNSMSQLIAGQLGIDKRYDDVAALTNATMALQCNLDCMADPELRDDASHACRWITETKETVLRALTVNTAFDGHLCRPMTTVQNSPDMDAIIKCKGSSFKGNINLFEHVQTCWKLGSLHVARRQFISMVESLVLPAIDRTESETLHLMVSEPSHWRAAWQAADTVQATILEIHLGLSATKSKEEMSRVDQWTECMKEVLENIQPQVVHVYHAQIAYQPTEKLLSLVNEMQYLFDNRGNKWTLWVSGDNVKHTQEYIPGTNRFMYISRTRDDEITINVEQLQDTLLLTPEDYYLERQKVFTFNIGFPTAHSDCQSKSEGTAAEWQEVISKLLDVCHPEYKLLIRCFNNQRLDDIINIKFKQLLRKEKEGVRGGYDIIDEDKNGIAFYHMAQSHENATDRQMYVYNCLNKTTTIRVSNLADIVDIKASHIGIVIKDTVTLCLSDGGSSSSTRNLAAEFGKSIRHLLDELRVQQVVLKHDFANTDGNDLLNMIHDVCKTWADHADFNMGIGGRQLYISRIQKVEVPDTCRCIGIYEDGDGDMNIVLDWLSDLLVLQKEHIKLRGKHKLYVHLLTQDAATTTASSRTEEWQQVCTHLLETFRPPLIGVNVVRTEPDIPDSRFHILLNDGTVYRCGWNTTDTRFVLKRKDNVQRVEVPGTSQCVRLYEDDTENMNIVVDYPSDCLVLHREHIKLPRQHELYVHLLTQDAATTTAFSQTEGWQQVCTHLLETFCPPLIGVNVARTECDIPDKTSHILLDDGTTYSSYWNITDTLFVLKRMDSVQRVEVPGTSQCVRLYEDGAGDMNIVVDSLSDCLVLHREHIKLHRQHKLYVHLLTQDAATTTASSQTEGWQQVCNHLLETFRPPLIGVNVVRTESDIPDSRFHILLNDGTIYHCGWNTTDTRFVLKRMDNVQRVELPDTSQCVRLYEDDVGQLNIVVDRLSDCLKLQREHIKLPGQHELYVHLLTQDAATTTASSHTEGWQQVCTHLLETFHPLLMGVKGVRTECGIQDRLFHIPLDDGTVYTCYWDTNGTRFALKRMDSVQRVDVPDTSRCVRLYEDGDGDMNILIDRLTDCLVLQREHIKRPGEHELYVHFLTQDAATTTASSHTEGWQQVCTHLLLTFHPSAFVVNVVRTETDIKASSFHILLDDGSLYVRYWDATDTQFYLTRMDSVQRVEVPDTSRRLRLYEAVAGHLDIVVDRLSDCLVLQRAHIKLPGEHNLHVYLLTQDAATTTVSSHTERWQQVITHLLETFHPPLICVNVARTESDIQHRTFPILLDDGTVYLCGWNTTDTRFVLKRMDNVQMVEVPDTSRCVRLYDAVAGHLNIVVDCLSDCLVLQRKHIKLSRERNLYVRLLTQDAATATDVSHTEGWQQVFTHLLETFHPLLIGVDVVRTESHIPHRTFHILLDDGIIYYCAWNDSDTQLMLKSV